MANGDESCRSIFLTGNGSILGFLLSPFLIVVDGRKGKLKRPVQVIDGGVVVAVLELQLPGSPELSGGRLSASVTWPRTCGSSLSFQSLSIASGISANGSMPCSLLRWSLAVSGGVRSDTSGKMNRTSLKC